MSFFFQARCSARFEMGEGVRRVLVRIAQNVPPPTPDATKRRVERHFFKQDPVAKKKKVRGRIVFLFWGLSEMGRRSCICSPTPEGRKEPPRAYVLLLCRSSMEGED